MTVPVLKLDGVRRRSVPVEAAKSTVAPAATVALISRVEPASIVYEPVPDSAAATSTVSPLETVTVPSLMKLRTLLPVDSIFSVAPLVVSSASIAPSLMSVAAAWVLLPLLR